MKTLFIEARYKNNISLPARAMKKLPKVIALFMTVQFIDSLDGIKAQLEKAGIKVKLFRSGHARHKGQLLGCSIQKFAGVDGFLYIGDGMFHPLALALKNELPVFMYSPFTKRFTRLGDDVVARYKKRKDAGLKRFLMSDTVGILVSTKPGQSMLSQAIALRTRLKKKSYILISGEIDFQSLENFPFIECFINTACQRIGHDDALRLPKPVVNLDDVISSGAV